MSIDAKTKEKKIDFFVELIMNKCKDIVPGFLINLKRQVNSNLKSYELISKDENFVRALEDKDKNIKI